MTRIKVCVILPGRAFLDGAVLWKSTQDTVQIQRGDTPLHPVISLAGRSRGLTALQIRSRHRFQHALAHAGVCYHNAVSSAHHRKGQLLSLLLSFSLASQVPSYQGGILKQLAVQIGNKSLPFSLLEPSAS